MIEWFEAMRRLPGRLDYFFQDTLIMLKHTVMALSLMLVAGSTLAGDGYDYRQARGERAAATPVSAQSVTPVAVENPLHPVDTHHTSR